MKLRKLANVALCAVLAVAFTFGAVLPENASSNSATGKVPTAPLNSEAAGTVQVKNLQNGQPDQYLTAGQRVSCVKNERLYQIINNTGKTKTTTIIYKSQVNGGIILSAANSRNANVSVYVSDQKGKRITVKSKVNALSSTRYMQHITFGALKGKTYQIRIEDSASATSVGFKAVNYTASYGSSYKKPSVLKNNERRKGFIAAGTNSKKYYKYSVKGRQVRVIFSGDVDSRLYAQVTASAPGYKSMTKTISLTRSSGSKVTFSVKSARRMTVQVRVYRYGTSSGIYYVMCSKMK